MPQKADVHQIRGEVHQMMLSKANLNDIKKTMAEVAANIESRTTFHDVKNMVETKVDRNELQFMAQQKVTFDDMKTYFEQMEQVGSIKMNQPVEELRE